MIDVADVMKSKEARKSTRTHKIHKTMSSLSSSSPSNGSKAKSVSFSVQDPLSGDDSQKIVKERLLTPMVPEGASSPFTDESEGEKVKEDNDSHESSANGAPRQEALTSEAAAAATAAAHETAAREGALREAQEGREQQQVLKSAIKRTSLSLAKGATLHHEKPMTVYCDDCHSEIPIDEWPNHRDRLRKVQIKERLSGLQKYLMSLFVDFWMWILVNVYFREVAVVGLENVPKDGPVVFYGNHQNQFIDAMMIRAHCSRPVRFIIAEKSMHRPVIGQFARMMEAVPVVRPQDVPSTVGQGKLTQIDRNVVTGESTNFSSSLAQGDVISWAVPGKKERCTGQIHQIISDTKLTLTMAVKDDDMVTQPTSYKCSRRIDHSEMYADVYGTLAQGHCIGIFPEGGSHDRTSLLPLKAGVALFSLGAYERNIEPKIIPCGLTYFYGHKFRSRAHIEFGPPIVPAEHLVTTFSTDKRKATGVFLEQLHDALRLVTINVVDWGALKFLHAFRRLYQPPDCILKTGDYLKLTRRLAVIMEDHEADPKFADFRAKVENYCDYCSALLVRDSQAATLEKLDESQSFIITLLFRRVVILVVMIVVLIPFFVMAAPIGLITHLAAEHHAKTALSTSSVKVVAADVKGSYKIVVGFALVPLEFIGVAIAVFYLTGDLRNALTVFISLPMAMYVSLLILQECVLELHAALPLMMSLFSKHKQFKKLFDRRQKLVGIAKELVRELDPMLEVELSAYKGSNTAVREPSLFSLRHSSRRLADKMK